MRSFPPIVRSAFASLVLACAAAAMASACSNSSDTPLPARPAGGSNGKCTEYKVPAGTDLNSPTVGFQTQVMPILQRNCSYGECHGKSVVPVLGFYGGGSDDAGGPDLTADQIKANLV